MTTHLEPGLHRTGALDVVTARREAEQAGFATFGLPTNGIVDRATASAVSKSADVARDLADPRAIVGAPKELAILVE